MTDQKKLHLGCFDHILPGWINTDITPHICISRVPFLPHILYRAGMITQARFDQHQQGIFRSVKFMNVKKPFPYTDNSIDCIYSSHLLEHLYIDQAKHCLQECYRILKPGGIVRTAVPDLDDIVAAYDPKKTEYFLDKIFESGQSRDKNQHHWHYNELSLTILLKKIDFKKVYRCQYRQGNCLDIDHIDIRPDSLFVEAVK